MIDGARASRRRARASSSSSSSSSSSIAVAFSCSPSPSSSSSLPLPLLSPLPPPSPPPSTTVVTTTTTPTTPTTTTAVPTTLCRSSLSSSPYATSPCCAAAPRRRRARSRACASPSSMRVAVRAGAAASVVAVVVAVVAAVVVVASTLVVPVAGGGSSFLRTPQFTTERTLAIDSPSGVTCTSLNGQNNRGFAVVGRTVHTYNVDSMAALGTPLQLTEIEPFSAFFCILEYPHALYIGTNNSDVLIIDISDAEHAKLNDAVPLQQYVPKNTMRAFAVRDDDKQRHLVLTGDASLQYFDFGDNGQSRFVWRLRVPLPATPRNVAVHDGTTYAVGDDALWSIEHDHIGVNDHSNDNSDKPVVHSLELPHSGSVFATFAFTDYRSGAPLIVALADERVWRLNASSPLLSSSSVLDDADALLLGGGACAHEQWAFVVGRNSTHDRTSSSGWLALDMLHGTQRFLLPADAALEHACTMRLEATNGIVQTNPRVVLGFGTGDGATKLVRAKWKIKNLPAVGTGAIVAIAVGSAMTVLLLVTLIVYWCKGRQPAAAVNGYSPIP